MNKKILKNKAEHVVKIYMKAGAPESETSEFKALLEKQVAVTSVEYISANQALINFKIIIKTTH